MISTMAVSHLDSKVYLRNHNHERRSSENPSDHEFTLNQTVSKRLVKILNASKHDNSSEGAKRRRRSSWGKMFALYSPSKKRSKVKEPDCCKYFEHKRAIKRGNDKKIDMFNEFVDEWNSCENACFEYPPTVYQYIQEPINDFIEKFEKMGKKLHKYDMKSIRDFKQHSLDPILAIRYDALNKARLISSTRKKWAVIIGLVSEIGLDQFKRNQKSIQYCIDIIDKMSFQGSALSISEVEHLTQEVEYHSEDISRYIEKLKNWNWRGSTVLES
jgi:hypothetical protein